MTSMPTDTGVTLGGHCYSPQDIERLERATARFIVTAVQKHIEDIRNVFERDQDKAEDVGEDLTREAIDRLGTSRVGHRLYGKGDYKTSRYLFTPNESVPQALLVDSKAEKGSPTITVEMTQTTLRVKQRRSNKVYDVPPQLPTVVPGEDGDLLSTTAFVKFCYRDLPTVDPEEALLEHHPAVAAKRVRELEEVLVIVLPSGALQSVYNPSPDEDGIWLAGRNSEKRGERFRVRVSLEHLAAHAGADPDIESAGWRVQRIPLTPAGAKRARKFDAQVKKLVDARLKLQAENPPPPRSEENLRQLLAAQFTSEEQETLWLLLDADLMDKTPKLTG